MSSKRKICESKKETLQEYEIRLKVEAKNLAEKFKNKKIDRYDLK